VVNAHEAVDIVELLKHTNGWSSFQMQHLIF